jgi:hypothetical protein
VNIRALTVTALFLVITPQLAAAQTRDSGIRLDRFTFQAAAGPLLQGGGHTLSAGVGFSPISRIDLLVNVERNLLPFERETFTDGYSITRGGELTAVTGEIRASLFPPHRASPFILAGVGGGTSRPTVNEFFPNEIEHGLRVVYFGAGVRLPLRGGLSIFGDARVMLAVEDNDGILGMWPVRAGLAWRF